MAEIEGPAKASVVSQAELTLQRLLQKQLATSGRLERVDFRLSTDSVQCIGHSSSGLASHERFCRLESRKEEAASDAPEFQQCTGLSEVKIKDHCRNDLECISDCRKGVKRNRYGVHPDFSKSPQPSDTRVPSAISQEHENVNGTELSSRHETQLDATILLGKDRIRQIAHLSAKDIVSRELLLKPCNEDVGNRNATPEDRARSATGQASCRTIAEVFLSPAPPVLDLHTYLLHMKEQHASTHVASDLRNDTPSEVPRSLFSSGIAQQATSQTLNLDTQLDFEDVPVGRILENRLSADEIKQLDGGRFSNYSPGEPSDTLYVKNLSPAVIEQDLVAVFIRYQKPGQHLVFRLMQSGRMKGQAFITFPDFETATRGLQLVNGFMLKDKPMIIEFARQRTGNSGG